MLVLPEFVMQVPLLQLVLLKSFLLQATQLLVVVTLPWDISNSVLMEWGVGNGNKTIIFPFTFLSKVLTVLATSEAVLDGSCTSTIYVEKCTLTNFNAYKVRGNPYNSVVDDGSFYWLSLGY